MTDRKSKDRFIIVSNRLPIKMEKEGTSWKVSSSAGGLVSALSPILKDRGGIWIGWTGATEPVGLRTCREILDKMSKEIGYRIFPVILNQEEVSLYYYGLSNEIIWPLFHDLPGLANFEPHYWKAYRNVNGKFARVVARHSKKDDLVWVHDYQLIPLARKLKELGVERKCVFFLHIPFPSPDIFMKLPWRYELLADLMEYELVAFQTAQDRKNFLSCLNSFSKKFKTYGRGPVVEVTDGNRTFKAAYIPISIDFKGFTTMAGAEKVHSILKQYKSRLHRKTVILGVDRLDYTKGIPLRLRAFQMVLEKYPELHENVTLVQIVVPSREEVPAYSELKDKIEKLVSSINGTFTTPGWVPVHYMYHSVPKDELIALYRLADIALVTPLRDGMNLVAKEYCACKLDNDGVLILSEFAGAAAQMYRHALIVNPYDIEGVAEAILKGVSMPQREKKARMRSLRKNIREQDVFWWVNNFLRVAAGKTLVDFPEKELAPILYGIKSKRDEAF